MNNKQSGIMLNKMGLSLWAHIGLGLLLFMFQIACARAGNVSIQGIDIATLAGDKLQIQLEMSGTAIEPKVFHTDNPARIALDFPGVKNALDKKSYPINQGAARNVYIAEAADRVRVVVNLAEPVPFDTQIVGNKMLLTLTNAKAVVPDRSGPIVKKPTTSVISSLMPEQAISGLDFKRGDKGEGRILVSLANPNTIVNSKEEGGKVVISFLNTRLPGNLAKKLDVSDFATPVKSINAVSSNNESTITVSLQNSLYDYSLFQSEGLLTVEFRPLTAQEKEVIDNKRAKYTGDRLSLNFQEIDVRSVIAVLAEFTGQNVVAGDDVTGTVTVKLDDVPWDEALDFIMMTRDLEKYETGNVTLIAPVGKIKKYKEEQRKTETVVEQLEPLVTEYLKINYAKAESFRNLLNGFDSMSFGSCVMANGNSSGSSSSSSSGRQSGQNQNQNPYQNQNQGGIGNNLNLNNEKLILLSARGSAVVDSRTNTLIVRETAKRLEEIKKLILKLDVPVRQVMIESRIVIATNEFAKELGVRFGVAKEAVVGSNKEFAVGGGYSRDPQNTPEGDATINQRAPTDLLVDLATSGNPYGALGMTLARGADYVLNLELSALQDQGRGELVSNPRVMTSDRCQATIKQGFEVPYQSSSANLGTNIQFKEALLQLDVVPQITPSGSVIMALRISKDSPEFTAGTSVPSINTREIETNVHVMDGETIVLGGVFEGEQNNTTNKVPFFADLPGIGFLFKRTFNQDDKRELLIFVTPKIIKDTLSSY
ncbi:MAG: type IV pilus secretin PilQ [Methylobacter sp.]|uniref:type IV pilus secretin family protein n=1 Tax=Methylobacter sp. TaxID=2051955 RepID=UPI00258E87D7|nr:type IV pilus secretin family protein [Methylobacter sp.]MCL7420410.1 type IV pilus secretin PilQ [Methylobacter sp.]